MSRFFPTAKRSLDSLFNLLIDLLADGLLFFCLLFRSRTALSAEVLFLRKQLAFYQERQVQPRRLNDSARFSLSLLSRLCNWKDALVIVKAETLIGWHRKGFKLFWKWKSQAGRPRLPEDIRKLMVQMVTRESALGTSACGSGTIGEVRHLCLSTYSVRLLASRTGVARPPEDLFAELEDVCPQSCPVGSMRRECLDFMIPLGEKHLRRILAEWVTHYNQGRPHLSLGPGIPEPATVFLALQGQERHSFAQDCKVAARAVLGGLHHEYGWERIAA